MRNSTGSVLSQKKIEKLKSYPWHISISNLEQGRVEPNLCAATSSWVSPHKNVAATPLWIRGADVSAAPSSRWIGFDILPSWYQVSTVQTWSIRFNTNAPQNCCTLVRWQKIHAITGNCHLCKTRSPPEGINVPALCWWPSDGIKRHVLLEAYTYTMHICVLYNRFLIPCFLAVSGRDWRDKENCSPNYQIVSKEAGALKSSFTDLPHNTIFWDL